MASQKFITRPLGFIATSLILSYAGLSASYAAQLHPMGAIPPKQIKAASIPNGSFAAPLPTQVDLTPWTIEVGDQGSIGSCVAWTIAHSMLGWYANRTGRAESHFSPMFMYSQINHGVDQGSKPVDGFNLAISLGSDTEADYYQGNYNWYTLPTSAEFDNASRHRIGVSRQLFAGAAGSNGINAIKLALANSQPVAISFSVRPGFDALKPGNSLDSDTTGTIRGYHAVLAVGYDSSGLVIQNSWGTQWGANGFGKLSWQVVSQDVIEANVIDSAFTVNGGGNGQCPSMAGGYLQTTAGLVPGEKDFYNLKRSQLMTSYPSGRYVGGDGLSAVGSASDGQVSSRTWRPEFCTAGGVTACGMASAQTIQYTCQKGVWKFQ
ncbi:MAG: C1 family peptidase [Undibacterium sp.]|nr:C1 family peptidase [Undibacterium sp.]